jgi:hypothetical protein
VHNIVLKLLNTIFLFVEVIHPFLVSQHLLFLLHLSILPQDVFRHVYIRCVLLVFLKELFVFGLHLALEISIGKFEFIDAGFILFLLLLYLFINTLGHLLLSFDDFLCFEYDTLKSIFALLRQLFLMNVDDPMYSIVLILCSLDSPLQVLSLACPLDTETHFDVVETLRDIIV